MHVDTGEYRTNRPHPVLSIHVHYIFSCTNSLPVTTQCGNAFSWLNWQNYFITVWQAEHSREKSERGAQGNSVFVQVTSSLSILPLVLLPQPEVAVSESGTLLKLETQCSKCGGKYTWRSQPDLPGKFPSGNLLVSFAVLCARASIRKVLLVFRHTGILAYHEPTYYYHQRHFLIPSVVSFWRKYQKKLSDSLSNKEVVLAGDGHHDSMGHSAKFVTYTIFCCTLGLIIHIVLIQACLFSLKSWQTTKV